MSPQRLDYNNSYYEIKRLLSLIDSAIDWKQYGTLSFVCELQKSFEIIVNGILESGTTRDQRVFQRDSELNRLHTHLSNALFRSCSFNGVNYDRIHFFESPMLLPQALAGDYRLVVLAYDRPANNNIVLFNSRRPATDVRIEFENQQPQGDGIFANRLWISTSACVNPAIALPGSVSLTPQGSLAFLVRSQTEYA
jgi:hypothetical protein